jgi:hypothetical protein
MESTVRNRPILVRCEREKCGVYAKYHYDETVENKEGDEHEERRVVEGCALALLPERLHNLMEIGEAVDDANNGLATVYAGLQKAGAMGLGVGAVVAQKYGMSDELNQIVKAVKKGETEPDEEEEEDDEDDSDDSEDEEESEEEEEDARTSKANG